MEFGEASGLDRRHPRFALWPVFVTRNAPAARCNIDPSFIRIDLAACARHRVGRAGTVGATWDPYYRMEREIFRAAVYAQLLGDGQENESAGTTRQAPTSRAMTRNSRCSHRPAAYFGSAHPGVHGPADLGAADRVGAQPHTRLSCRRPSSVPAPRRSGRILESPTCPGDRSPLPVRSTDRLSPLRRQRPVTV